MRKVKMKVKVFIELLNNSDFHSHCCQLKQLVQGWALQGKVFINTKLYKAPSHYLPPHVVSNSPHCTVIIILLVKI